VQNIADTLDALPEGALSGLVVALGLGLLIGVERERRKGEGSMRAAAGVRTFSLVAILGACAALLGSPVLLGVLGAGISVLALAAYLRSAEQDPGLTTEVALILTFVLGALAIRQARLAAGLGVLVALLLVSRSRLHDFVSHRLSDSEVRDAILLAAAALIVLPILPNRAVDPYGVINPQVIWRLTVLVLLINALGYIAVRTLGAAAGLALSGFFSGFVSSIATIAAMGSRAREHESHRLASVAGAALSSVATVVQLALVLAVANYDVLLPLMPALAAMAIVSVLYAAVFAYRAIRQAVSGDAGAGRAFQPRRALAFALMITATLFVAAFLADRYGAVGASVGIAMAGFADAHSASASAASLARSGTLDQQAAILAIVFAVTTNTLSKAGVAFAVGGWKYARALVPGLALMLLAMWIGAWFGSGLHS
jgi:uncharacterized membrane protein (DUF4010 family)